MKFKRPSEKTDCLVWERRSGHELLDVFCAAEPRFYKEHVLGEGD